MPDLPDSQIRDLVARAVNDAPPPPEMDAMLHHVSVSTNAHPRRSPSQRWATYGAAGLAAAAATVGLVVVALRDTDSQVVPQTTPSAPSSLPPSTVSAATTAVGTDTTASPSTIPASVASTSTTPPEPAAPAETSWLAVAGSNGVTLTDQEGTESVITNEPMAVAIASPNGSVYMQRLAGVETTASNPILSTSEAGTIDPLPVPAELADRQLLLRDVVAAPDGPPVLLVEAVAPDCNSPETCDNILYAYNPGADTATTLGTGKAWEFSVNNISYGSNGLMVSEGSYVGNSVYSLSSSPDVTPIEAEPFGIKECSDGPDDCSRMFTVDTTGTYVAWIDNEASGKPEVVIHQTDGRGKPIGTPTRIPVTGRVGLGEGSAEPALVDGLNIADISFDPATGELTSGRMVAWWGGVEDRSTPASGSEIDLVTGDTTRFIGYPSLN